MANILDAIINIIQSQNYELQNTKVSANRINAVGNALEEFVIDSFASSINDNTKNQKISQVFSYLGNNSNPPDAMLKNGAALEIKKIQSRLSLLQLNSSHPKLKLYATDSKITQNAVNAEEWTEKDFIYAIGVVDKNKLKELALIDASVYFADNQTYTETFEAVKSGLATLENIDFSPTKEIGKINKIDPLGITSLRVRGMWLLENPFKVFDYIYQPNTAFDFNLFALISADKFKKFENKQELLNLSHKNLKIEDVQVQNPNNPAQLIDCKKIIFWI
jgi:hypothetical protein